VLGALSLHLRGYRNLVDSPDQNIRRLLRCRQAAGGLHDGEAEALVLARKKRADWFLTDDAATRLFVSLLGIEVHGSLGIVLWNAAKDI